MKKGKQGRGRGSDTTRESVREGEGESGMEERSKKIRQMRGEGEKERECVWWWGVCIICL